MFSGSLCCGQRVNSVSQNFYLQKTVQGLLYITVPGCIFMQINCVVLQTKLRDRKHEEKSRIEKEMKEEKFIHVWQGYLNLRKYFVVELLKWECVTFGEDLCFLGHKRPSHVEVR